ncbi:dTDP-4-dehydrorhamnose 3,5-epimerase [Parasphingopyxis sp.]|uniref:dTDP-4-dehydrorhamnose 3,5-epimerase n=1 Tax=Parasphingopyxis sp. TaxID=1920299 RepID=UPI0026256F04|nr:dTDP-4-dehydrorhamnose 3,5-epimerase [Parasphingopyxis sp.]
MKVVDTDIPDVKLIEPKVFADDRGFFFESWRENAMAEYGIAGPWVQDNHSRSAKGVLRGIHYQVQQPQGKLVRVTSGAVLDVAVDLRQSSPTFGKHVAFELSAENKHMLWVPPGFGHAFLTLEDDTDFLYKCTDYFAPEHDRSIRWDDPDIGINWPLAPGETPDVSDKDAKGKWFKDAELYP